MTDRIPADIYRQCTAIAKSYYTMLKRRKEQEEIILHGSPVNDGSTSAVRISEKLLCPSLGEEGGRP